ncbi:F0F1 ATP synthase subunit delta [Flaviflexus massiliensis]|uniref:F0F1 ATP synthase subunit delta n=1 Tax=Flaviflexus massiliensis TaxID=1522309 RepID=UPI0006D58C2D|nr:F0F1 ATP synthase subunit delta [Flaviflexus massiliensis]
MRLGSEQALQRLLTTWEGVVANRPDAAIGWAKELFAAEKLLGSETAVARVITDPARSPEARAELVSRLFEGKVSGEVKDFLSGLAREPFRRPEDIVEAIARSGVETLLMSAQISGRLQGVEEELYRASRTLSEAGELRRNLDDRDIAADRRISLVNRIFGSWSPETVALLEYGVANDEHIIRQLRHWIGDAGRRSQHLVAIVTAAAPLAVEQEQRLTEILTKKYGKPVEIHVGIDPALIGGVRISIGPDVIDGSLASRINHVKSVFAD